MNQRPQLVRSASSAHANKRPPLPESWRGPQRPAVPRRATEPKHPWPEIDFSPTLSPVAEAPFELDTLTRARLRAIRVPCKDALATPKPLTVSAKDKFKTWGRTLKAKIKEVAHVRPGQSKRQNNNQGLRQNGSDKKGPG